MAYHIDTGLIKDKFNENCECPLCEIKQIVEEQFLHEFLNDAVMEDNTRIKVGKEGFCARHFDMLFIRQNKLSVALQIGTRVGKIDDLIVQTKSVKAGKKQAKAIENTFTTCAICDYVNESMVKYYKTIAQMFCKEKSFIKTLLATKGFCLEHYAELLKYANYAGFMAKEYVNILSGVEKRHLERVATELRAFCDSHDYRNAGKPLGNAETALPRMRTKLYGKKYD